jgi:fatty-acyl-CoA synthase
MLHADVLGERAAITPGREALYDVASGERFTYAHLDARARRHASAWLDGLGLAPGDRIGLLAHNCVEFFDAVFAAAKSGVILVPLSTRATARELQAIVADCALRVLMYGPDFCETVTTLREAVKVERYVALDAARRSRPGDEDLGALVARAPDTPVGPVDDPEWPLCLLYTSGTTGKPKGVIHPHRMVAWNACNTVLSWQLREDDVSPIFTPLYHAGGLGAFLAPILAIGGRLVLHRGFDTGEIWRLLERERCTVVLGVPTIYKLLMDAPEFATVDLSHVRWLISGGAPLPHYIIEAYQRRGVTFKQGYGLTEVGVNCFAMSSEDSVRKAGSIGRPMMFTRAKLLREDGAEAATDEVGELCLRGPHVCKGYWNNPEATAAALDADAWFHTGDLAKRDTEGFYRIAGRKKDMIISGGVNIYPAEVEGVLVQHPEVADAAVVGVPHDTWGEVGVAFVVRTPGSTVGAEALAAYLGGMIAKFKVPREIVFVEALPRTPYGKVLKDELRKR